jgi:ABC-2 type transport system permease protein
MNFSIVRALELARKEVRQLFRDRRMIAFMFGAPMLQLVLLGYAISTDVRDTTLIVLDRDRTAVSRALVESFESSGRFRVVERTDDSSDITRALDHGSATAAIEIPRGFTRDLQSGNVATIQLLFDGTNSNVATVSKSYAERIALTFGVEQASIDVTPPIDLRERAWFNPALESRNYNVPGVAGIIVYFVCLLLTSLGIVREREIGTLEQLMVSPLKPMELIVGKSLPVAIIGLADVVVVTLVAVFLFDVPFRGNILHLLLGSALYLLSGLGLGLFISTISKTQQEAFMGTVLIFMPSLLLGGFMFPIRSMPQIFQWITQLNPVRHYLKVVRAIFLKGVSPVSVWPEHLALLAIGLTVLVVAAARFEKRMR